MAVYLYRERLRDCIYVYGRLTSAVIAMETLMHWGLHGPQRDKKEREFTIDTNNTLFLLVSNYSKKI